MCFHDKCASLPKTSTTMKKKVRVEDDNNFQIAFKAAELLAAIPNKEEWACSKECTEGQVSERCSGGPVRFEINAISTTDASQGRQGIIKCNGKFPTLGMGKGNDLRCKTTVDVDAYIKYAKAIRQSRITNKLI